MKKIFALFLIVFCLEACEQQMDRDTSFMKRESENWYTQKHTSCDKLFGFAWGFWSRGRNKFVWVATADPQGYVTVKIDARLPARILRRFIGLGREFEITANGITSIRILNNNWIATHAQPQKALEEILSLLSKEASLNLKREIHHTFR